MSPIRLTYNIPFRKRIFLQQKVTRLHIQFQTNRETGKSGKTENVDITRLMPVCIGPILIQHTHRSDPGRVEQLVFPILDIVTPQLHVIGRETKRFHMAVAYCPGMGRCVRFQYHLLAVADSRHQPIHIRGILPFHDAGSQGGAIVNRCQLTAKVLLQKIGFVQCLYQLVHDMGFLVREMHQLGYILKIRAFLA